MIMDIFKADAKVAEMLKKSGRFEILDDERGRFSLTIDSETYSEDVYIDTLTYGAGLDDSSAVTEYMDVMNPEFSAACTRIAGRLGWLDPVEDVDPYH
jgi:hypothetical protein